MLQTEKVTSKVIQGHWQKCHYIGHILFHISVPLQLCRYLSPFSRYFLSLISQNLKKSRDSEHIPFGSIGVNIMHWGKIKNGPRD